MGSHSHDHSHEHDHHQHEDSVKAGFELTDANIPLVFWTSVGIVGTLVLCMIIAVFQFNFEISLRPTAGAAVFSGERRMPPGPRLQAFPAKDLAAFKEAQRHAAESYGWTDKNNGVARVPVDRAIEMVMSKGVSVLTEGSKPAPAGAKKAEAAKK